MVRQISVRQILGRVRRCRVQLVQLLETGTLWGVDVVTLDGLDGLGMPVVRRPLADLPVAGNRASHSRVAVGTRDE